MGRVDQKIRPNNGLNHGPAPLQDNVSRAFIVRVTNASPDMQAHAAQQSLRYLSTHLDTGSSLLLCTCTWLVGEFGDLLDQVITAEAQAGEPKQAGEEEGAGEGWTPQGGAATCAIACLEELAKPSRSSEVR
jgi:hypothetical protein